MAKTIRATVSRASCGVLRFPAVIGWTRPSGRFWCRSFVTEVRGGVRTGYIIICERMMPYRACLDQHLIAIRSPGIRSDHLRSGTSLIAITWLRWLSLSRLLYKLGLTGHLEIVINCTVIHATWRGGWEMSQHQQPVVRCGGDPGVSECTVKQWLVAGKTNSHVSYYQTQGWHVRFTQWVKPVG